VSPGEVTYPNGARTVYKLRWFFWRNENSQVTNEINYTGAMHYSLTLDEEGERACFGSRFDIYQDRFASDGSPLASNEFAFYARNVAFICVTTSH